MVNIRYHHCAYASRATYAPRMAWQSSLHKYLVRVWALYLVRKLINIKRKIRDDVVFYDEPSKLYFPQRLQDEPKSIAILV